MISKRLCLGIIIISLYLPACNSSSTRAKETTDSTAIKPVNPVSLEGCYMMNIEKDTAVLQLRDSMGILTGPLEYRRFEKDDNTGIFTGSLTSKNTLEGWYRFSSEGLISLRQVIFKVNSGLVEGYGEMELRHDSAFFKYPSNLRFEENHPFLKQGCK